MQGPAPCVCARLTWWPVRSGAGGGVCDGVLVLSRLGGHQGYSGGVHLGSRTCGCICWR